MRDSGGRFDAVISVTAKLLSVCVDDSDVATTRVCVDFASNGADGAGISGKGISGELELSDEGVTDPALFFPVLPVFPVQLQPDPPD